MKPELPIYGAAGALALLLVVEWLPASAPEIPPPPPPSHVRAGEPESVARDTAEWANAIIRRPLFTVGRKPPKNSAKTHAVASTGLPRLSGIMITAAGKRAIFMPEGGKALTVAEGGSLDDYTVRRISADRVVLSGPKGDMTLKPAYDASSRGSVTAAPVFGQPGFTPPQFNPGFNPGFNPAVPGQPGFTPGQPTAPANDDTDATPPPQPPLQQPLPGQPIFPGLRGPFIPRGRN